MAKINGISFSDSIPEKHTRDEFINKFGHINCGGCKDLGKLYDKIVAISGTTPKLKKVAKTNSEYVKKAEAD